MSEKKFLKKAKKLYDVGHEIKPAITCVSKNGEYRVEFLFINLNDAQRFHAALCKFFEGKKYSEVREILNFSKKINEKTFIPGELYPIDELTNK